MSFEKKLGQRKKKENITCWKKGEKLGKATWHHCLLTLYLHLGTIIHEGRRERITTKMVKKKETLIID